MFRAEQRLITQVEGRISPGFMVKDFLPGEVPQDTFEFPTYPVGILRTLDICKGGKKPKRELKLRDARIGTTSSVSQWYQYRTPDIPYWGSRRWEGHFGACILANGNNSRMSSSGKVLQYFPLGDDVNLDWMDDTLQRAFGNINKPKFDSQLMIGEMSETIGMLKNPAEALISFLLKIHRSKGDPRKKRLRKSLTALGSMTASGYLQYIYGIEPLVKDIKDALDAIKSTMTNEWLLRSGGKRTDGFKTTDYGSFVFHGTAGVPCPFRLEREKTEVTRSVVYYRPQTYLPVWEWIQKWGFNPIDLPITAWQTVSASFVFDWFLNVGQFLRAIKPREDLLILGNSTSVKTDDYVKITPMPFEFPTSTFMNKVDWSPSCVTLTGSRLVRVVNRNLPLTVLAGKGIDSIGKALGSAAMLWQRIPMLNR